MFCCPNRIKNVLDKNIFLQLLIFILRFTYSSDSIKSTHKFEINKYLRTDKILLESLLNLVSDETIKLITERKSNCNLKKDLKEFKWTRNECFKLLENINQLKKENLRYDFIFLGLSIQLKIIRFTITANCTKETNLVLIKSQKTFMFDNYISADTLSKVFAEYPILFSISLICKKIDEYIEIYDNKAFTEEDNNVLILINSNVEKLISWAFRTINGHNSNCQFSYKQLHPCVSGIIKDKDQ